jgi:hypothetical protein
MPAIEDGQLLGPMIMSIGFTGSSEGMTEQQKQTLIQWFEECVGMPKPPTRLLAPLTPRGSSRDSSAGQKDSRRGLLRRPSQCLSLGVHPT